MFEDLFEKSYGRQSGVDPVFRATLKRDLFVQGLLLLKWQEKVLPTAGTFADALHQARIAEEQERQLAQIHKQVQGESLQANERLPAKGAPGSQPLVTNSWGSTPKGNSSLGVTGATAVFRGEYSCGDGV